MRSVSPTMMHGVDALRGVFETFDRNGSGGIDLEELEAAFKVLGVPVSKAQRAISSYGEIVMPMWGLGLRVGGRHQRRSIRIRVGAHVKMITGQAQGRMEVFCIYYIST